jgi:hypothetical protein
MSLRRVGGAVMAAIGVSVLVWASPASAKVVVAGPVNCDAAASSEVFSRPLQDAPLKVKKSKLTIVERFTNCIGDGFPVATPAPGNVVSGVMTFKATLPDNRCHRFPSDLGPYIRVATADNPKITWYNAGGAKVGTSKVAATYMTTVLLGTPPENPGVSNVILAGTVAASSKFFPGQSFDLEWPRTRDAEQVDHECSGAGLSSFALTGQHAYLNL